MNAKVKLHTLCEDLTRRLCSVTARLDAWESQHEIEMENAVGKDALVALRSSKELAVEMLVHSDPKFRLVALDILTGYWQIISNEKCINRILEMACNDPHQEVRASALFTLGACFRGTDNSYIGRILAEVVRDNNARWLKYSAYYGLLRLQNRPTDTLAHFPENIDYEYVNDFLSEARNPSPKT